MKFTVKLACFVFALFLSHTIYAQSNGSDHIAGITEGAISSAAPQSDVKISVRSLDKDATAEGAKEAMEVNTIESGDETITTTNYDDGSQMIVTTSNDGSSKVVTYSADGSSKTTETTFMDGTTQKMVTTIDEEGNISTRITTETPDGEITETEKVRKKKEEE